MDTIYKSGRHGWMNANEPFTGSGTSTARHLYFSCALTETVLELLPHLWMRSLASFLPELYSKTYCQL